MSQPHGKPDASRDRIRVTEPPTFPPDPPGVEG
jgi:hypothetical protein